MSNLIKKYLDINVETAYGKNPSQMRSILKNQTINQTHRVGDSREFLLNLKDAKINDGVSEFFARNGFELFDYTPNLPLSSFFWNGLVPVRYGGGYAEQVSAYRLAFQMPEGRITGTLSNDRILSGVKESKITVPAYPLQFAVGVTEFELMKSDHINYDILGFRLQALGLGYQRELELMAFMGNEGLNGITPAHIDFKGGLLNQPTNNNADELAAILEPATKNFHEMDLNEWVDYLIKGAEKVKRNLMFNTQFYPNTLLVPPTIWSKWLQAAVIDGVAQTKVGVAMNMVDYLEEALSRAYGQRIIIRELPYLDANADNTETTAGIKAGGEYGKLVLYRNDDRAMRFHITLALTGGSYYQTHDGWFQNFLSIFTPLLVIYPTITYYTNIAPTEVEG